MRVLLNVFVAITFSLSSAPAFAGAGAVVQACVSVDIQPLVPYTVNFTAGSDFDECMNSSGESDTVSVGREGLNCVSVDYVEGDASLDELCATRPSTWTLSYHTDDYSQSGTTRTDWDAGAQQNTITLREQSPGTHVCPTEANCVATSIEWDTGDAPHVYIIFDLD
ncbi:hypothetical protein [Pseudovibrio sp. Tun.PSC04-5.I4]|uniref:hypothetical protein n=1 Tax=Pseudovibrio sp. Tun.PSC04-5.I4 TaxID=1798213 RepID=UPI000880B437|nr:hypothetical protein [Pseudovibrio sp. Tun.PSC04-5.I4]SDR48466.1 hypothetical protein SAMN04515695_5993 [Pseudovibrio sp. Tun.PSC04-5.I4]